MLAIVLGRKDIREFDQTISVYTQEIGKVEVLAKGIKKIVSKNSANLVILSVVDVELIRGKDIEYLGRVQPVQLFRHIYADLDKLYLAGYAAKLVDANILAGEKDERVFNLLMSFFQFLNTAEIVNSSVLITAFTLKLWYCLGFSMEAIGSHQVMASWESISGLTINQREKVDAYDAAFQFAQQHAGVKLAKFIENDRIIG